MDTPNILYDKEGFLFSNISKHQYHIQFFIENNHIHLDQIVDFNLMKLIYDLNPDIYLYSNIEKMNENEAKVTLLLKHFFEDLGMPQRYSYISMKKHIEDNQIIFTSKSITDYVPENIPANAKLLSINNMQCICKIETHHKIMVTFNVQFNNNQITPPRSIQKMMGIVLHKIFKRVKQFIENVK
jgi:hypothetical protein